MNRKSKGKDREIVKKKKSGKERKERYEHKGDKEREGVRIGGIQAGRDSVSNQHILLLFLAVIFFSFFAPLSLSFLFSLSPSFFSLSLSLSPPAFLSLFLSLSSFFLFPLSAKEDRRK